MKDKLLERFLRYVSFDTQSDPHSGSYPSTAKQIVLLDHIATELRGIRLEDVETDEWGYVTATLPASAGYGKEPVIGFLAHVDTSPDMPGAGVKPQVVEHYDGGGIRLNDGMSLSPDEYPELLGLKGHTIITTDGTTLLGADDKAGAAAIVSAAEFLAAHPEIPHGRIRIGFTPDEEIGRGVDHFDIDRFGADYAYTVDGGAEGELEYENFNAAEAVVTVHGTQMHPGYAKGRMKNALRMAAELDAMLPPEERPENTSGYEGFYHLTSLKGDAGIARMEYIIRDFDRASFDARKRRIEEAAAQVAARYGNEVGVELRDQYYNMYDVVSQRQEIVARAAGAMARAGVTPLVVPIRGGTDGARLSYMGLPCPNIFTGGGNFHSAREYCSLDSMLRAAQTVINIARADR